MLETTSVPDQYSANKLPGIVIHETELLENEAKIALDLIIKWGMVAASDDGEDSTGRAKMKLLTPEEVVTRAFDCAKLALEEARKRNLTHTVDKLYENLPKAEDDDESK